MQDYRKRSFINKLLSVVSGVCLFAVSFVSPAAEPIVIGLPLNQTGPVGVADHQDHLNGTILAIEEINAAGGVLGRQLAYKVVDTDLLTKVWLMRKCMRSPRLLYSSRIQRWMLPPLMEPLI